MHFSLTSGIASPPHITMCFAISTSHVTTPCDYSVRSGRASSCTAWRSEAVFFSLCSSCLRSVRTSRMWTEVKGRGVRGVAAEVSVWAWGAAPTWQPWMWTGSLTPTSKCKNCRITAGLFNWYGLKSQVFSRGGSQPVQDCVILYLIYC